MSKALADISKERQKQIDIGYDSTHDDEHSDGVLARAAASYAVNGGLFKIINNTPLQIWPYKWNFKQKNQRERLVIAAALLVAEIERIDRLNQ